MTETMKIKTTKLSVLVLSIMGCTNSSYTHNQHSDGTSDTSSIELTNNLIKDLIARDSLLHPFKAVLDTLNSVGDNLVRSEYFLHDISGDNQPELWIISGTCEADKELWVYQYTKDSVKKILSEYGGHTEFFLKGQYIGSLTCNTGDGYVSAFTYKDGNILVESIEYNGWTEKELVKVKTTRDKVIADIWENSDSTINLKPLK